MERIFEALKSVRRLELFLLVAVAAILLLFGLKTGSEGIQTELEERMERVLSHVQDVGMVRVMIREGENGTPVGALVVAEGADRVSVRLNLQYAVKTLLGVEINRIEVVPYG
ncbi:MAG: hypothetical protein U0L09_07530 [Christensenellales bacterium]|nr:hypothetical protein [Christensenellales bacterium]